MVAAPIKIDWNPALPIFASEPFLRSVSDRFGWLGAIDDSGKAKAILPYTLVKKPLVCMARFRVQTIALDEDLPLDQEREFLAHAVDQMRSFGADLVIPATTNTIFRTYPEGSLAAPYGTLVVELTRTEEDLWRALHPKHRNVIRNAQRKGVRISRGVEHADAAYRLISETFRRSGMRFMKHESFLKMLGGLAEHVEIFLAESAGIALGCAVVPYSLYGAYYFYGGSAATRPITGALNLLQWESMLYFKSKGVRRYDFCGVRIDPPEGSKQASLMMFKQRFGASLVLGYMWKQYLNPIKSLAYRLAMRALRSGDIVDQERSRLGRKPG